MLDHTITHLEMADAYAANASRIVALKKHSKHLRDLHRRCCEAAEQERAEAAAHIRDFQIDPLLLRQERAAWQRLRQYPLDRAEALALTDRRWLRAVFRHGRPGSRNVRRAAELLLLADESLGDGYGDDEQASATEASFLNDAPAEGGQDAGTCPCNRRCALRRP